MNEYNFRVFIENRVEINTTFHAKNEKEAWIMVRRQYPSAKGFKYELLK